MSQETEYLQDLWRDPNQTDQQLKAQGFDDQHIARFRQMQGAFGPGGPQGQMLKQQQEQQQRNPGFIPGSQYNVNFGLAARDPNSVGMQGYNAGLQGFQGALGQTGVGGVMSRFGGLGNQLANMAAGKGPSAAQAQFQSGLDQSLRSAMALAQSQAGASPGAALRSALEAQGTMSGQANAQAAALRAQEQQSAIGQYGNLLGGMGQLGLGQAQAYLGQGQLGAQMSEADRQALLNLENQRLQGWTGQVRSDTQVATDHPIAGAVASGIGGLAGGIGSAAGTAAFRPPPAGARGGVMVVPGKAQVAGDSERNDKVPSLLSPGEVVLPRSVVQADDAPEKAAEFVAAIRKRKMQKKAKGGEIHPLKKLEAIRAKLRELNSMVEAMA